jgi:ASC-1-like (ASCH) protein
MKNITILAFIEEQKKQVIVEKLSKEFIVKVNTGDSDYVEDFMELLKDYHKINNRNARKIKRGDYIVFVKNDFYVEMSDDKAYDLDLPVLKLTNDYTKIEKLVKNYFKNVYSPKANKTSCVYDFCPFSKYCENAYTKRKNIVRNGDYMELEAKVTIGYNYVKVGYDAYTIYTTRGREFVDIEDAIFEVKDDRKGYYLELVK